MSIIIVDDNATNQMIIRTILRKEGYNDIRIASSAMELYDMLHIDSSAYMEEQVDLILLDMMMPEIDGLEACRRIVSDNRYRDVPIVFVTAVGDSMKLAEALDAGATDYVMKPINKLEMLARIRSALRLKHEKDWHRERDKRIRYELELAKQVQRSVLSPPIRNDRICMEAEYRPSSELAGDYYAWFPIDRSRYGVILLDMMGHGISSSLVCMFISSVLKDMVLRITDPEEVMQELNNRMGQLYRPTELVNFYFTAIFVLIDTENRTLQYANAGHPAGIAVTDSSLTPLETSGPAVGLFDSIHVRQKTLSYEPGMTIVLYTDGLLDAIDVEADEASLERIAEGVRGLPDSTPGELVDHIIQSSGEASKQRDDICMVRIQLN
ncbi:fused response regulator/phosphatase [Paenibacillus sp. PL2-23]|uniref:PP2C family protein-serine/threonine phosphatase n=1 Tax=Paenibacillus sp. PL2-23 TaxID=2100729 RepID=UPI0030F5658E